MVLNGLETASDVIGLLCPNKVALGSRSTVFELSSTAHTATVESVLAVIRVFESANNTHVSWP